MTQHPSCPGMQYLGWAWCSCCEYRWSPGTCRHLLSSAVRWSRRGPPPPACKKMHLSVSQGWLFIRKRMKKKPKKPNPFPTRMWPKRFHLLALARWDPVPTSPMQNYNLATCLTAAGKHCLIPKGKGNCNSRWGPWGIFSTKRIKKWIFRRFAPPWGCSLMISPEWSGGNQLRGRQGCWASICTLK